MALKSRTRERIIKVLRNNPEGLTISDLGDEAGITRQTASKYLETLKDEGNVEKRKIGQAKVYYPKREVSLR